MSDVALLLVGAGIALASTLLTTIVTTLLNYSTEKKLRELESKKQFLTQVGKAAGLYPDPEAVIPNLQLTQDSDYLQEISDSAEKVALWTGIFAGFEARLKWITEEFPDIAEQLAEYRTKMAESESRPSDENGQGE